ncbi:hypothetical protein ACSHWB_21530 [Lentzea sp. HUAS TT2]|uniref:hypothetical protein n=1 Tax=Lentzea sp. HUAS TT2 TaxID=3447454 RepID=UPI003F71CB6F
MDLSRSAAGNVFTDHRNRTFRSLPGESPDEEVWTPEKIQKAIVGGRIVVAGPGEVINGKETVRLTVAGRKPDPATQMWVDASTHLPMRWRWEQDGATAFDVT